MAGLISQVDPNKTKMASNLDVGNEETQMKSTEIPQATPLVSAANAQPETTTQTDKINVNTQDGSAPDMSIGVQPEPTAEAAVEEPVVPPPMTTEEQAKETMKGVDAIIGSDSPLMERAALQGQQLAASRGLGNSSFSSRAAQGAVYDAAIPLATQAAELAGNERMLDRKAEIDRLTQARDQAWQSGEQDLARQLERELADQSEQLQRDMEKSRQDWQSGESQLDREQQERIADKEADLRKLLQEDAQQFDLDMADINKEHAQLLQTSQLASSLMEGHYNRLAEIYANPELDEEQQNAAMANLNIGLNNSLAALQGLMNTDIGKWLPGLDPLNAGGGGDTESPKSDPVNTNPNTDEWGHIPIPEKGSGSGGSYGGGGSNNRKYMN